MDRGSTKGESPAGAAPRALYVTDRLDAPFQYRCVHPALQLRSEGVRCDVVHIDAGDILERVPEYSVVVLFRLPWSSRVAEVLACARLSGATAVFDIDDLVFDPDTIDALPFLGRAPASVRAAYRETAEALRRTLAECDAFIGATPALARAAERLGKRAFVYPNLLHPDGVALSARIHRWRRWMQRRPIISYVSGSNTHDRDVASIAPVLGRILSERADAMLMLIGFLEPDPCLDPFADRVIRVPHQDRRVYPWTMNLARVNIAPIAEINEFTDGKSALKFFEAGAIGLPTVASPTESFRDAITHPVDGFLAAGPDEWYDAICTCLDSDTARRVGEAARRTTLERHTHAGHRHRLRDILASVQGRPAPARDPWQDEDRPRPDPDELVSPPDTAADRLLRARAVLGVVRRVGRPQSLSRPELCRPPGDDRGGPVDSISMPTGVDIVVPIYNAREDVRRCIESVLRHATGDWRLVLVDDASTDAALAAYLRQTAEGHDRVTLLRNPENAGFVVSANRGMKRAGGRDIILLNSDTIVTEHFVDRLIACAYSHERAGIVSPLTNNGTICSVPEFCRDNALPNGLSVDAYAGMIARTGLRRRPELVTAVGFCMYIRADVIERIGYFDEERFGRGYGEENDFCERAKAIGYEVRLCDDLFIAHTGHASFGAETPQRMRENSKTLDRLHPHYFGDVADYCRRNPLRDHQDNVRYHLGRQGARRLPAMLYVLHATAFGEALGGTEHHVRDLIRHLSPPRAVVVYPEPGAIVAVEILEGRIDDAKPHRFETGAPWRRYQTRRPGTEAFFDRIIDLFDVGAAHLHHLLNLPVGLWRLLQARGIPYSYSVHDYYCVCPSVNQFDFARRRRCDCPDADGAARRRCVSAQLAELHMPCPAALDEWLEAHRREFRGCLEHAAAIIGPSRAALDTVCRHIPLPEDRLHVVPHGYAAAGPLPDRREPGSRLRAAIIGQAAYPTKGAEAYVELLERSRDLPIEWHLFGDAEPFGYGRRLSRLGLGDRLHLHGPYERSRIRELLAGQGIDVSVFLPAVAETFCFTLSESWLAGVPAVVLDLGALPERVAAGGAGVVVRDVVEARDALARFAKDRSALAPLRERASAFRHPSHDDCARRHREAYGAIWRTITTPRDVVEDRGRDMALFEAHQRAAAGGTSIQSGPRSLPYQGSWWYPWYRRARFLVPPGARGLARRAALRRRLRWIRRYRFDGGNEPWLEIRNLEPSGHSRRSVRLRATGRNALMVLDARSVPTDEVDAVLLRMRCRLDREAWARLSWDHDDDQAPSDAKSVDIRLDTGGAWHEYLVDFRQAGCRAAWRAGTTIGRLRFRPVDAAAHVDLRELSLVRYRR